MRLEQGDMARATVFNRDPAAQAQAFAAAGLRISARRRSRRRLCRQADECAAVERILGAVKIPVQLGGGIRDLATVEAWLGKGVARVIIGTAAVRDPALVKDAARAYPGRVAVGLDARDGKVAVEGWAATSEIVRARNRAALRGRRRRRDHLHRRCARRHAQGSQSRRHHRARRCSFDPGHRLGRSRLDRRRAGAAGAARQKTRRRHRRPRAL